MARTKLQAANTKSPQRLKAKLDNHDTSLDTLEGNAAFGVAGKRLLVFTGHNLAGACTATGAKVGDKVVGIVNLTTPASGTSLFEATITVADQIQQSSATDLSAKVFALLLQAKS